MVRLLCTLFVILGASYGSSAFGAADCPLDFSILNRVDVSFNRSQTSAFRCKSIVNALELVLEEYFRDTGLFLRPANSMEHCLSSLQAYFPDTDIRSQCRAWYTWVVEEECMGIHSKADFESVIPDSIRTDLSHMCHMVKNLSSCSSCRSMISNFQRRYLHGNHSCAEYLKIYVIATSTPVDQDVVQCLLSLYVERILPRRDNFGVVLSVAIIGGFLFYVLIVNLIHAGLSKCKKERMRQRELELVHSPTRTERHSEALGAAGSGVILEHTLQEPEEGEQLESMELPEELGLELIPIEEAVPDSTLISELPELTEAEESFPELTASEDA